jgi:hypothetical protein
LAQKTTARSIATPPKVIGELPSSFYVQLLEYFTGRSKRDVNTECHARAGEREREKEREREREKEREREGEREKKADLMSNIIAIHERRWVPGWPIRMQLERNELAEIQIRDQDVDVIQIKARKSNIRRARVARRSVDATASSSTVLISLSLSLPFKISVVGHIEAPGVPDGGHPGVVAARVDSYDQIIYPRLPRATCNDDDGRRT